jgi:hypothetical protein
MPRPTRAQLTHKVQELEAKLAKAEAPNVNSITISFADNGRILSTASTPVNTPAQLRAMKAALDGTLHFVDDMLLDAVRREAEKKSRADLAQPENEKAAPEEQAQAGAGVDSDAKPESCKQSKE